MIRVNSHVRNFLYKEKLTSLVVVKVDSHGNPDSVSYWKNLGKLTTQRHKQSYVIGALLDICV